MRAGRSGRAALAGPFGALTPSQLTTLHATLGGPAAIPAVPPPGNRILPATWAAYGAENQFISVFPASIVLIGFLLALGEDYNILVMTRIREEEASRIPLRQAVTRALERTGPTVSSAGLILVGTFGVFAAALGRQPGGAVDTGILASIAIGIWNWWPFSHSIHVD